MPRTVPLSAPRDNPFARYPSSRFTREENPLDEEELFLDEVSEENPQDKTSLSNCRKKISFIPPLAHCAAPTVPAWRAPGTPARQPLRSLRALRVAALLTPTPRALRSAPNVAALRARAARLAEARPCAGPSPRRENRRAARGSTRLRVAQERVDDVEHNLLPLARQLP